MKKRYIEKLNASLSPLGFGVMRLHVNADGTFSTEAHRLLTEAYEKGINYFDTAYPYLGGRSEELIRNVLVTQYPRDSFYIADKLPVWDCRSREDMERIFDIQLERLGVEYIDFYLLHGLNRFRWADMSERGVIDFLETKRREGRIRKVGFSMHDDTATLKKILDAYDWEFAQLQINYYDWSVQNVKESYELLVERDIPCMVMEPVGGGRLAKLPEKAEHLLKTERPKDSIASWAVRFAAGLPNVAVTLSGMTDMEQLNDNIARFDPFTPLSKHELSLLDEVVQIIRLQNTIPCSGCRYCIDKCPVGVDIPQIFQRYNDYKQFSGMARFDIDYYAFVPEARRADKCLQCRQCVAHCPQMIDIPLKLKQAHNVAVGLSIGVDISKLKEELTGSAKLVCFGAGAMGRNALNALHKCGVEVDYFCDNSVHLWGTEVGGVMVISPLELQALSNARVLITSGYRDEIREQLDKLGILVMEG